MLVNDHPETFGHISIGEVIRSIRAGEYQANNDILDIGRFDGKECI